MQSNEKTYNRGDDLLKKFIAGQLSDSELNELNALAEEDPFLMDALTGYKQSDLRQATTNLEAIRKESTEPSSKYLWLRSAAAIGLFMIAGLWVYFALRNDGKESTVLAESAQPESQALEAEDFLASRTKDQPTKELRIVDMTASDEGAVTQTKANNNDPSETLKETFKQNVENLGREVIVSKEDPELPETNETDILPSKPPSAEFEIATVDEEENEEAVEQLTEESVVAGVTMEQRKAPIKIPQDTIGQDVLDEIVIAADQAVLESDIEKESIYNVSGQVQDESGQPLIGVTFNLMGTDLGAISDIDGNFMLQTPTPEGTIEVSYTGYESISIPLQNFQTDDPIVLHPSMVLDEVVVVGADAKSQYEAKRKKEAGVISGRPVGVTMSYPRGGYSRFESYLKSKRVKSESAIENDITGEVELTFTIMPNGSLEDIRITQSLGFGLDEEAIRLLKEGPKWRTKPRGEKAEMRYRIAF